jgi:hypothetical protein
VNAEEPFFSHRPTGNESVIDMRQSWRPGFIPIGIVVAFALGFTSSTSQARVRLPQPIYFWASVASTIRAPGLLPLPEVVRPSGILLFADGSWDIGHLHWKGWGSSVAHASGISSASNGIPNVAQGKRINTPGQITLSHPGRFFGREVYRCFALTVQPPATDLHGCLEGHGGYYYLSQ